MNEATAKLSTWKIPEFNDAAVLIGFDRKDYSLCLDVLTLTDSRISPKTEKRTRERLKGVYEGVAGKKYAIAFYKMGESSLMLTDFFRAVLIDPKFYVKNLLHQSGILAIAADEYSINEVWKSDAERGTDEGVYIRLVEMLNIFWKDATDLTNQATVEYYRTSINK